MRVFTCSSGPSRLLLGSDRPVCAIDLRNPHESASGTRAVPVQPSPASRQCLGAGLGPGPLGVWDKRIPLARLRVAFINSLVFDKSRHGTAAGRVNIHLTWHRALEIPGLRSRDRLLFHRCARRS